MYSVGEIFIAALLGGLAIGIGILVISAGGRLAGDILRRYGIPHWLPAVIGISLMIVGRDNGTAMGIGLLIAIPGGWIWIFGGEPRE